jgi:hypothetical protein
MIAGRRIPMPPPLPLPTAAERIELTGDGAP